MSFDRFLDFLRIMVILIELILRFFWKLWLCIEILVIIWICFYQYHHMFLRITSYWLPIFYSCLTLVQTSNLERDREGAKRTAITYQNCSSALLELWLYIKTLCDLNFFLKHLWSYTFQNHLENLWLLVSNSSRHPTLVQTSNLEWELR